MDPKAVAGSSMEIGSRAIALALRLTRCVILGNLLASLGLSLLIRAKTSVPQMCHNTSF